MATEREKMLAGELYDCADEDLQKRWHKAKELTRQYNYIVPTTETQKRTEILNELVGAIGEGCAIAPPFYVDYGENIYLGRNVEINMDCCFLDCAPITIGDYTGIAPGVHIYTVFHPTNPAERLAPDSTFWRSQTAPVNIGRNVWIGGRSIILPGVTIGDNSTIGAASVVVNDIPPNCVAVGNPAKVIKYL